jgi:ATPase
MIGVVHASNAIDAIQRFILRTELGMIPHIIDTVIFIKEGEIKKVYELGLVVRVPTGMTEADLARPIVEIRDFETGKLEYEIYTFGEENVIVPVATTEVSPLKKLAAQRILQEIERFDPKAQVELVSDTKAIVRVENDVIPKLIGKDGNTISTIEKKLGIHIEVEPKLPAMGKEVDFQVSETGNSLEFSFDRRLVGKVASFYVEDEFLFSATVGKKGKIKVNKSSDVGKKLIKSIISKKKIRVLI